MGEEVTQNELVNPHKNSNNDDNTGCVEKDVKGDSIDEVNKTITASSSPASHDECNMTKINDKFTEKCENYDDNSDDTVLLLQKQQMDKSVKKLSHMSGHKAQDTSIESKSRKWYNISFINRGNNVNNNTVTAVTPNSATTTIAAAAATNSRNTQSSEKKNSDKMDKRHSWHLNDSAVVEM